jgi:hypothetical protein
MVRTDSRVSAHECPTKRGAVLRQNGLAQYFELSVPSAAAGLFPQHDHGNIAGGAIGSQQATWHLVEQPRVPSSKARCSFERQEPGAAAPDPWRRDAYGQFPPLTLF